MDNLGAHKVAGVQALIEAAGARLLYLPHYSADLNPIEAARSQCKSHLRAVGVRWPAPSVQDSPASTPPTPAPTSATAAIVAH